jgi:hypothetical protein
VSILAAGVWSAERSALGFPSPLAGPGRPALPRSEERVIEKAWKQLERGRADDAARQVGRAGSSAAAELLRLQLLTHEDPSGAVAGLRRLCEAHPSYAAAWATLATAAAGTSDDAVAYSAATLTAELWPDSRWAAHKVELGRRLIDDRIVSARRRLAEAQPEAALAEIAPALALEPGHRGALAVRIEALIVLERLDEAEGLLVGLGDDATAPMLAGRIAERRGDWLTAMERYGSAPPTTPGRSVALQRAQLRWRLSVLPTYVQAAIVSPELSRVELAVLMIALAPQLEAIENGRVPLLTDIVDLPSQREIVAAVRLELMEIDPLEHRFFPNQVATEREIKLAVDRLAEQLGAPPPLWCSPPEVVSSCLQIAEPVSGQWLADLVVTMVFGESK